MSSRSGAHFNLYVFACGRTFVHVCVAMLSICVQTVHRYVHSRSKQHQRALIIQRIHMGYGNWVGRIQNVGIPNPKCTLLKSNFLIQFPYNAYLCFVHCVGGFAFVTCIFEDDVVVAFHQCMNMMREAQYLEYYYHNDIT